MTVSAGRELSSAAACSGFTSFGYKSIALAIPPGHVGQAVLTGSAVDACVVATSGAVTFDID